MFWIGTTIALSGLILALTPGDSVTAFINLPGLVFVSMVGCGVVIAAHGPGIVGVLLRTMQNRGQGDDRVHARLAAATGRQSFLAAGWIGLIIGVVQLLSALDNPAHLSAGLATALLTVFYAQLIAWLFWLPLERRLTETPNLAR